MAILHLVFAFLLWHVNHSRSATKPHNSSRWEHRGGCGSSNRFGYSTKKLWAGDAFLWKVFLKGWVFGSVPLACKWNPVCPHMFCFADVSRSLASLGQVSRTNSHHCCGTKASDQTPKQNHPVRPSGRRRNTRGFVCFGKRFDPQSCSATAVSGGDKWTINQRKAGFQWFQSGVLQRIKP